MLSFVNALLYPHGLYAELDVKGDDTRRKDFDFSIPNGLVFCQCNTNAIKKILLQKGSDAKVLYNFNIKMMYSFDDK